jgi:predicted ester cyclase
MVFDRKLPPSPEKALPVVTFSRDVTFHLGGEEISVVHVDPAHTDGDGEFEGIPPTQKRVKWVGFDLMTLAEGRIAQGRFISDSLGLLRQLGATVSPPPAKP